LLHFMSFVFFFKLRYNLYSVKLIPEVCSLVGFSIFTKFCKHLIPKHSHHPIKKPCTLAVTLWSLLL
jgi:hypothetical protein